MPLRCTLVNSSPGERERPLLSSLLMEATPMGSDEKSNRTDAKLARLAAEGDSLAFDEIYSRYRRVVHSIALRMTGNLADGEDLTQASRPDAFGKGKIR
jgi:Sigma-70 region 2